MNSNKSEKKGKSIIEAYTDFNNQLIIAISGLSGTGKGEVAKSLGNKLNLKHLKLVDYHKKNFKEIKKISSGKEVINWDHPNSIDWEKLKKDIEKYKNQVIISGQFFPKEYLTFNVDIQINISLNKQKVLEKRNDINKEKNKKTKKKVGENDTKLIFNQITFPQYLEFLKESKVNKFINANEISIEEVKITAFEYIIKFITEKLRDKGEIIS
jgi:cytidylate kinase